MNDTELIEGCKAGKREALETIYRLFSRQMYGVCYRYVGEDSALDVMHDGFVKVFSAIGQLHATDLHGFRSWITRIMVTTSSRITFFTFSTNTHLLAPSPQTEKQLFPFCRWPGRKHATCGRRRYDFNSYWNPDEIHSWITDRLSHHTELGRIRGNAS